MKEAICAVLSVAACCAASAAFDIGKEMETEAFWKSDPVMFVKRHQEEGFRFTSTDRESADTRLDGAVTYHGIPVFESKIAFTEDGRGVARVELILFSPAGTEVKQMTDATHYRLVRSEKSMDREGFVQLMKSVRAKLTPEGKRSPTQVAERTKKPIVQKSQTWPKTAIPTETTLTWNYSQVGTKPDTFEAGFVRLSVDGPERLAKGTAGASARRKPASSRKIADNVVRDPRGDVFIDNRNVAAGDEELGFRNRKALQSRDGRRVRRLPEVRPGPHRGSRPRGRGLQPRRAEAEERTHQGRRVHEEAGTLHRV